jgi:hypothetical protein
MIELLRTNDPVLISFVKSLLLDAGIQHTVADPHMSTIEGGIGALPKRVMVVEDRLAEAQQLLTDADVGG